jgi:hypothetical protein
VTQVWGALNFYEYVPVPYRWAGQTTYLLTKKFNSVFSLGLRYKWQTEDIMGNYYLSASPSGLPYPYPQAQRVGSIDVLGTFHLDTNSFSKH